MLSVVLSVKVPLYLLAFWLYEKKLTTLLLSDNPLFFYFGYLYSYFGFGRKFKSIISFSGEKKTNVVKIVLVVF